MVERICPACQHGNPLDDRFCGKCGVPLERQLPARRSDSRLTIAGRDLPVTWQQLGKTVAMSVAALAAEAGLAWLRRRIEAGPSTTAAPIIPAAAAVRPAQPDVSAITPKTGSVITIVSQRVVEIWDSGAGQRQIIERNFWQRTEE